jgi:MoxR-like ATPase
MPGRAVVGRAAELDVVEAFLAAVDGGPARLLVEGEPGIGKTTVWQAATARARERRRSRSTSRNVSGRG